MSERIQANVITIDPALPSEIPQAQQLLAAGRIDDALLAADQLLRHVPSSRGGLYLRALCLRRICRVPEALETLLSIEKLYPELGRLYQERGFCNLQLKNSAGAVTAFERAVALNDSLTSSWLALRDLYRVEGRITEIRHAEGCLNKLVSLPIELLQGSDLLAEGNLDAAEQMVRAFLRTHGNHIEGMRLLAQIAVKHDILDDAEMLLDNIVQLAPNYTDARYEYAVVLSMRRRYLPQLMQARILLQCEPNNTNFQMIYALACDGLGEYEEALQVYKQLLSQSPDRADLPVLIANALKTFGDQGNAIKYYLSAAALRSTLGSAYFGLANMKTYKFTDAEIRRIRNAETTGSTSLVDQYNLCFALGKALEDRAEFAESFHYYERGNSLKRGETAYDPSRTERHMCLQTTVCTREFFTARKGSGCPRPDPIFIVGLPRSGSTLIEQILASHSQVDGTLELPDIPRLAHQFRSRNGTDDPPPYPAILNELSAEEFREMGEKYIEETQVYRQGAAFFVDKMPSNFREIGLIQLILPNARIIDARREPMACGFGNFKQLFSRGQDFSYSLNDIGRYYRNYIELMKHWDQVLPGKILRVQHEEVVDDLAASVRRILDYCELTFDPACLEFYKTERSVRTVSSEQVRRPIYRDSIDQWRNYEPWLGPLKMALGSLFTEPA